MDIQLRLLRAYGRTRVLRFRGPNIRIGRATHNDIIVGRAAQKSPVSKNHAVIELAAYCAVIRDLGSRTGTYVNDWRIGAVEFLEPGDVIQVGRDGPRMRVDAMDVAPSSTSVAAPMERNRSPSISPAWMIAGAIALAVLAWTMFGFGSSRIIANDSARPIVNQLSPPPQLPMVLPPVVASWIPHIPQVQDRCEREQPKVEEKREASQTAPANDANVATVKAIAMRQLSPPLNTWIAIYCKDGRIATGEIDYIKSDELQISCFIPKRIPFSDINAVHWGRTFVRPRNGYWEDALAYYKFDRNTGKCTRLDPTDVRDAFECRGTTATGIHSIGFRGLLTEYDEDNVAVAIPMEHAANSLYAHAAFPILTDRGAYICRGETNAIEYVSNEQICRAKQDLTDAANARNRDLELLLRFLDKYPRHVLPPMEVFQMLLPERSNGSRSPSSVQNSRLPVTPR